MKIMKTSIFRTPNIESDTAVEKRPCYKMENRNIIHSPMFTKNQLSAVHLKPKMLTLTVDSCTFHRFRIYYQTQHWMDCNLEFIILWMRNTIRTKVVAYQIISVDWFQHIYWKLSGELIARIRVQLSSAFVKHKKREGVILIIELTVFPMLVIYLILINNIKIQEYKYFYSLLLPFYYYFLILLARRWVSVLRTHRIHIFRKEKCFLSCVHRELSQISLFSGVKKIESPIKTKGQKLLEGRK